MINMLVEAVKEAVGTKCTVYPQKVEKNNGIILQGIVIKGPETEVCPIIYIDELLKRIKNDEISLQDAAMKIAVIYNDNSNCTELKDIINGLNREYILKNVVYQIVNMEKNAGRLDNMPYKKLLDLAVIYNVVCGDKITNARITIKKETCNMFAITEEELDTAARQNTEMKGFSVQSIASVLSGITGIPKEVCIQEPDIFVISNRDMINGATVMLYSNYFDNLAKKLGSDLYVLPSSIHEVLVVPAGNIEPDALRDMVCSINASELDAGDVLSSNVYRYSCKDGALSIA